MYPPDEENSYPYQLSSYIYNRFFKDITQDLPVILDIGCCTGAALKTFEHVYPMVLHGIDIRDEGGEGFIFKECNLERERIPYPSNYFDCVYTKSVIEHVRNTDNFLGEAQRVLKPGGVLVVLTPDWKSQYKIFWNDYTHVKPFTRKGLRDALKICGFEESDCEYFYQLPFIWKRPWLRFVAKLIALLPDFLKWKDREQRNTRDRKLIRFSKEIMLLGYGVKK